MNDVWFQQNGKTCQTSHATIDLLHETFDGRLVNRNDGELVTKNLRILLDCWCLCESVKEQCMPTNQRTIEHFKDIIRDAIAEIQFSALENGREN